MLLETYFPSCVGTFSKLPSDISTKDGTLAYFPTHSRTPDSASALNIADSLQSISRANRKLCSIMYHNSGHDIYTEYKCVYLIKTYSQNIRRYNVAQPDTGILIGPGFPE